MTSSRRWLAIAGCSLTGLALAAPTFWVNLTHHRVNGTLLEVLVAPLADGQARLSVIYDFPGRDGVWMGCLQDDGWMRPGTDPVLPLGEAQARAERLRNASLSGERRRVYPVWYQVNDPAGTAFISLTRSPLSVGWQLGIGCLVLSLILSLPIPVPFLKVKR